MRCLRKLRYFVIWPEKVQIFREKIGNTEIPWHGILPFFEGMLLRDLSFIDKKCVSKNQISYFVNNYSFGLFLSFRVGCHGSARSVLSVVGSEQPARLYPICFKRLQPIPHRPGGWNPKCLLRVGKIIYYIWFVRNGGSPRIILKFFTFSFLGTLDNILNVW